jgi:hypothetical protein
LPNTQVHQERLSKTEDAPRQESTGDRSVTDPLNDEARCDISGIEVSRSSQEAIAIEPPHDAKH